MQGLHFQSATPPVRSDPARADIACFVGVIACRPTVADLRARLARVLTSLGWQPPSAGAPLPDGDRVVPATIQPFGNSGDSFSRWLETIGWRQTPNGTAAIDLFRYTAAGLFGSALADWWTEYAWLAPASQRSAPDLLELSDVPVPIDSWDAFDTMFAWDQRPLDAARVSDTALGAAVRRFFLQGGRKCYVVRVGNPWAPLADPRERVAARDRIFPAFPPPTPADRTTWHGVSHLFGLPDVSFLCVPDLPDLFAVQAGAVMPEADPVGGPETFVECQRSAPSTWAPRRTLPAARCDEIGFPTWAAYVGSIGSCLRRYCPEVQLIAAMPLVIDETSLSTDSDLVAMAAQKRRNAIASRVSAARGAQRGSTASIRTGGTEAAGRGFVQLAYPWLRTVESSRLPGGVEAPDGMLAGMLAANALSDGTWHSVAYRPASGVVGVDPILTAAELQIPLGDHTFQERVSTFAPTSVGFQILSDVTVDAADERYRPANVGRLVASILRAARIVGENAVFDNNGAALWRRLQAALEELMLGLWGDGALDGASASDAFDVRCDDTTMTRADLDAGRVIVRVAFRAASPVEQIVVVFAMDEGGQVTLAHTNAPDAAGLLS